MKVLVKLFGDIITSIWCMWSNYRFKNVERFSKELEEDDRVSTYKDIQELVIKLYGCFIWTADGIDQLGDAITPPPQNYKTYLERPLKDDCDGFHSLVYHCLYNSGIKCYLLTANPIGEGHCVLAFTLNDLWYVIDYNKIYGGYTKLQDAINRYNKEFMIVYKAKEPIYNGLVEYNYEDGKFRRVNII